MRPKFFATPALWRRWLEENHASAAELLVGFRKRGSGKPSITWPESVDQALCFGWIDGVRRSIDDESYTIRFTPRRERSNWSAINCKRVEELVAAGQMRPAGLAAYQTRDEERTAIYSYERARADELPDEHAAELRANAAAWRYFSSQPPWYRKAACWWIASAKKEETRLRRLATLIEDSAAGRPVPPLRRPTGQK